MQISTELIMVIFLVGFVASTLDAIAGGGGLITLPAILMVGLDPVHALATNKFQSSIGSTAASVAYARRGLIQWRTDWPIMIMAAMGGGFGAMLASITPKETMQATVPILLIGVAAYFFLSPKFNDDMRKAKISTLLFNLCIVPLIGLYDGIFGPGTGSFFTAAFVGLLGSGILYAIAHSKLANTASNLGALLIFASKGLIVFPIAIPMAIGAIFGAQIGTRLAVRYGGRLIKPLIIVVSLIMALKLLLDPSNPLMQLIRS